MRFRALGPVQVWDGTSWVGIRAPQQRLVLAILLTQAGRVVTLDRLVREIWPYDPPRAAIGTIQTYVLRLRRLFADEHTLVTKGSGYQLMVADDDIDIQVFERLVSTGRQALAQDRLAAGVDRLSAALGLWRGPAMAGVPESATVAAEAARLELHRVAAFEDQAEARLALGRHSGMVDELRRLVKEHPFRERLLGQLMLALYRSGRPVDALETYRRGRRLLRDELGLDPCPELRWLERAIRDDDPGLRPSILTPDWLGGGGTTARRTHAGGEQDRAGGEQDRAGADQHRAASQERAAPGGHRPASRLTVAWPRRLRGAGATP